MKTLLYTVSDFKPLAAECIDLLFSNIEKSKTCDIDTCVVTSELHLPKDLVSNYRYKIITDNFYSNYIGFLKYSKNIPLGYDSYIYLDSDILYFGRPEELISEDKDISIVFENLKMSNEWFKYQNIKSKNYDAFFEGVNGINAGSFCFKDVSFLKNVRDLFEPYIANDVHKDARLEQSSFNFAICKYTNFDLSKCFDISSMVQLFASDFPFSDQKKLYHFCGFSNEMRSKFFKMKFFLNEKQRRVS